MPTNNLKRDWVDEKRLHDPRFWFMKAYAYASTCSVLWTAFPKVAYIEENPELCINAIRATPYLAGLASELFMKGYLIYKDIDPKKVESLKHNLEKIRKLCRKFGDIRFDNKNLVFLTGNYGKHLMEEGGIRYPDKHEMVVFPEFKDALDVLQEICGEAESDLMNVEKIGI